MQARKIRDQVYWMGAIDWDLRNFHGYLTQRGTTYNSYLIVDEKIALVDTVKHYKFDEMLKRIEQHVDPADIDSIDRRMERHLRSAREDDPGARWSDAGYWLAWPVALLALFWFRKGWSVRWGTAVVVWGVDVLPLMIGCGPPGRLSRGLRCWFGSAGLAHGHLGQR